MRPLVVKSLQEIILDNVVKYFARFIAIYNDELGVIPRKHFEFLQRTYSRTVLSKLVDLDAVNNKYLPFLLNPYLKELDLRSSSFYINNPNVILDQLKNMGSTLTHLDLRHKDFSEDVIMQIVCVIPCIKSLYLSQTECSDKVIKLISAHCAQLEVLDMSSSTITDSGLTSLCKTSEKGDFKPNHLLRKLHVVSTNITQEGLKFALKYFPCLEVLDHELTPKTIYQLHKSQNCSSQKNEAYQPYVLTELDFLHMGPFHVNNVVDNPTVEQIMNACSVMCPNLEILNVDNIESSISVETVCKLTKLKEVKLSSDDIVDYSEFIRHRGCNLVKLELDTGIIAISAIVQSCPRLKRLILHDIEFEKPKVLPKEIVGLPSLTYLTLGEFQFLPEEIQCAVAIVTSSPNLETLCLPYCQQVDEHLVSALLKCKCMTVLRKLDFSFSDLTVDLAQRFLLSTPCLEKMDIDNCYVSSTEYDILMTFIKTENLGVDIVWRSDADYESDYENDYENDFISFHSRLLDDYEFAIDEYADDFDPFNYSDDEYCYEDEDEFEGL